MLGPHLPPPPLGPSEGKSSACTFGLPDGSYRCLALEAEESGGEEGLQGEAGLTDLEENEVARRSEDNACRATQGAPQLPRARGIQSPSCSREVRGGSQHDNRASQDWDTVKAQQVMTASLSPSPGPRVAQKPALGRSTSLTEKDLKEAKARSQQIAAQLTTPPSSNSRGVQLFNRRRQRVNEFTLESRGQRGQKPGQESLRVPPASPTGHAPGLSLSPTSLPEPGPPRNPACQSADTGVPGHSMEGSSEEASLLRHLEKVASEEEEVPLVVYLKENAALLTANGLHLSQNREAQQTPPTPPPAEVHSPATDASQNLPSPGATLITPASNSNHNPPATDVDQNPPATVTPQSLPLSSVQQNSSEAQLPPKGAVPDFKPSTPCAGGQPQEPAAEVRSSTLLIDKVSAPPTTTSTFSREVTPISSSRPPAPDFMSSSLLIDVQLGAPVVSTEQEMSGRAAATTPIKLYSEVHLTLAKPPSVVNRTARPFGIQAPGGTSQMERSPMVERRHLGEKGPAPRPPSVADRSPRPQRHVMSHSPMLERRPVAQRSPALERRPLGNFTPPPTYAETLSTAPLTSRVRSPPSYSALYPSSDPKPSHLKGQAVPASKTGILEESIARRGSRKSMFTFVEKPKVTPNPDLLDLVQTADEKRRQRDQGEMGVEEEPFALGAEASNFQQEPAPRDRASPAGAEEIVPEWASCLKSPRIQAKPKPKPNQNLSEASGKGAELYARRQSRMEKYVIESSGNAERARCPSPTMSLPSCWKYPTNAPGGFRVASRSPARTPPASLYHGYLPENGVLRPEPSRQPPCQLRPSLFVLSPIKEPAKSSPTATSPAKPSSLDLAPSLPKAALPPSPALPRPSRSSPGLYTSPGQDGLRPTAVSPTYSSDVSPVSPSRAWSPRAKQAPRPSFSTRNAGIEAQDRRENLPTSPPWTPGASRPPSSLDGWVSPGPWEPGRGSSLSSPPPLPPPPPPPMSPSWSERSVSPLRPETEARPPSRQLQALLARNIINAARRKSASPRPAGAESLRPFSPPRALPPPPPPPRMRSPLPARPGQAADPGATFAPIPRSPLPAGPSPCASPRSPLPAPPRPFPYRRSPTDSDVSLDSEDSGAKSPGILGYNICPRGWNGSLRLKRGSLPTEASCTT
ncbi:synaptopodin isoform X1 [Eubalaena glacialis]|uniref:synaptopodin isoform X1 n=2 Tax=Eubalaena glacialis TaxID=27606 RepID=UPI002A59EB95|nr:synaptopodin isoform X1 [Eubalaena glacialis]XP_061045843.1 synaptopodin isoform X1 [Eubalaena glacialis]XP_061045844.1 synaptopodin isoform X1 [Eubalaena glacialis]XP_061045845.1 synaptopodin isoform X1 [Eubalaena glacialis]